MTEIPEGEHLRIALEEKLNIAVPEFHPEEGLEVEVDSHDLDAGKFHIGGVWRTGGFEFPKSIDYELLDRGVVARREFRVIEGTLHSIDISFQDQNFQLAYSLGVPSTKVSKHSVSMVPAHVGASVRYIPNPQDPHPERRRDNLASISAYPYGNTVRELNFSMPAYDELDEIMRRINDSEEYKQVSLLTIKPPKNVTLHYPVFNRYVFDDVRDRIFTMEPGKRIDPEDAGPYGFQVDDAPHGVVFQRFNKDNGSSVQVAIPTPDMIDFQHLVDLANGQNWTQLKTALPFELNTYAAQLEGNQPHQALPQ